MPDLDGAVALVTGASRGLGAAVAIELARLGAHPVITARSQGGLEETDDAIRAAGGSATLLPLDLREADDVDKLGPSIFQRFQRLDILVHCAASLGRLAPVSHLMPYEWAEPVEVNFNAAMRLMRTAEPLLRRAEAGRAVFVTDARAQSAEGVLGGLCVEQSGARAPRAKLGRRARDHIGAGEPVRPAADGDAATTRRIPRRDSD